MVARELITIFKEITKPRDFSFEGIIRPARARRRLRLAGLLIKDVALGKITPETRRTLQDEIRDAILDSPFLKPFLLAEEERLRGLVPDPEDIERRSKEIEKEARDAAKKIEAELEKAVREARKRAGG